MSTQIVEHNHLSSQINDIVQPDEELHDISNRRAFAQIVNQLSSNRWDRPNYSHSFAPCVGYFDLEGVIFRDPNF